MTGAESAAGDTYNGPTAGQRGNQNTQNNYYQSAPSPLRASWPHQVGVMPSRAECFQARAEADRLRQMLAGGVLSGLGGVGKTQLAADYARTALSSGEVDVLVWISAGTRSAVVDVYAQAAAEVLGAGVDDPEEAARVFLAWLEPKSGAKPCRWLVVLDDVADPAALKGLWPPSSPRGRTLVTTRRRDAALVGQGRRRIDVGEFTATEAADYVTAALAAHDRTEPAADIAGLAWDLGCLPLALSQVVAYLIDAGKSCAAYRAMLAGRARTLTELSPDVLPDDQSHTMAAAWSLSVEYADALRPVGLARPMLQLAAFLAPNGIPTTVLTSPPALNHLSHGAAALTPDDATGALRALHRLSLLDAGADAPDGAVRVHQLVQRATRDTLTPAQHDETARAAADALAAAWPETERDTALGRALRACTTVLTGCAEAAVHQPDVHPVVFRAGLSLGEAGQVRSAIGYFQHLAATTRHHLGPDHVGTLTARHNLAHWRGEAGDAAGAAAGIAEVLEDMVRVLGPDHPRILIARGNVARWRGQAGDAAGTAAATAEVLDHMARVLGPDHSHTLTTRNNLASWTGRAGDPDGAVAAFAELLADRERVLGADHPRTLVVRHNLAYWRGQAGDAAGAAQAFADLLADRERVLGPDHPHTLNNRSNLAHWRGVAGDAAGAAAALAELLADRERVLGPDHPATLTTRRSLAYWQERSAEPTRPVD